MSIRLPKLPVLVFLALMVLALLIWSSWPHGNARGSVTGKVATQPASAPARMRLLAGDGGVGAQDGAGTHARFADPYGLVLDGAGNLYVADGGENNRIRKIASDGSVSTLAGSVEGFADGSGSQARLHTPSGLALDAAGNIYVADTGNHAIRKITPQGVVSTVAGDGVAGWRDGAAGSARFNGPIGLALDALGNIYVADTYNDRIRRITPKGEVTTIAGGAQPGYQDGTAESARFDTPTALVFNLQGELLIADTRNHAVRKIDAKGMVSTLAHSERKDNDALLRLPQGLALGADGTLFVSNAADGRILQLSNSGEIRAVSGIDIDFATGSDTALRLQRPVALVQNAKGNLLISDGATRRINLLTLTASGVPPPYAEPAASAAAPSLPWPVAPQNQRHEIVGTMGEVRGNHRNGYKGNAGSESMDHFHGGLDIQADRGSVVLAVADGKVSSVLASRGMGELAEGLTIGALSYNHIRVGRNAKNVPFDSPQFQPVLDARGKLQHMRVARGTRFKLGQPLGSINDMNHVHLEYRPSGQQVNPLLLGLIDMQDSIAPRIESITLLDAKGQPLTTRRNERLLIPANTGPLSIVVEADDQMDGNAARRQLGLYRLGYQILHPNGNPLPGFAQPQFNLEFNHLPDDDEMVALAYAPGSGASVFGERKTRYRYLVSNVVRDGVARAGAWQVGKLVAGEYIVRISAMDFAGNVALRGRDLAVVVE